MARSSAGARLTEAHQVEQSQIQDSFVAEFIQLWPLLDPDRLEESGPAWVRAVMQLLRAFRLRSARAATDYYRRYRLAEVPGAEPIELPPLRPQQSISDRAPRDVLDVIDLIDDDSIDVRDLPDIDWGQLDQVAQRSLQYTGPLNLAERRRRREPERQARDRALVQASGAASRHVANGGRLATLRAIDRDDVVKGYIRVTKEDPCYFCAMLASRGPVFRSEWQAGGSNRRGRRNAQAGVPFLGEGLFKVHDHCRCTVEPVMFGDANWPGRGREFQKLWNDNIRGRYTGEDAIRAWRRFYERQQRELRREQREAA
jgi:hypothetical protein